MMNVIKVVLELVFWSFYWLFVGPYRLLQRIGDNASKQVWLVSRILAAAYLSGLVVMFGSCGVLARQSDPPVSYLAFGAAFGIAVFALIQINQIRLNVGGSQRAATFHGTARWANDKEVAELVVPEERSPKERAPEATILPAGHFFVGYYKARGILAKKQKVCLTRQLAVRHGMLIGTPGSQKTRGFVMPNLAWSRDTSMVTIDIKNENWNLTSGYHPRALRYAPNEPEKSECFNFVPLCQNPRIAEICARAIVESGNTSQTAQFFLDTETGYLMGILAHASTLAEPTLLTVYRLITRQRTEQLLEQMFGSASETAREQAAIFEATDARYKGSIIPAVASKLKFMQDSNLARFTSASLTPPNFAELRRVPTAVYYSLREQDIARLRPLTGLFFTLMLEQIAGEEIAEGETSVPITMLLDEFANIGTIPDFSMILTLARGRNVAIWIVIQALAQLEERYGQATAQTIMAACVNKIALSGLDVTSAEYISKMLGETTIVDERPS